MSGLSASPLVFLVLLLPRAMVESAPQARLIVRNLEPVPFPDTSRIDPLVQQQLAEGRSLLQSVLEKPAKTEHELGDAYGTLGMLYHVYQHSEAAAACYRNAHTLAPQEFRWLYYLGRLYKDEGKVSESAASFKAALEIQRNDVAAQLGLAEVLLAQDHLDESEQLFTRVLAADERSAAAMAGLGKCASARRDFAKAAEYFEAALRVQPESSGLHYPLAIAYRQLGDRQRALGHLSKRGDKLPSWPDPLMDELRELNTGKRHFFLRGLQALRQGDLARAAEEYQKLVAVDPSDPVSQLELGAVLVRLGNYKAAIGHFSQVLRVDPDNSSALYNLGILHTRAGSSQEAIRHYEAALHSDPASKVAHFQLANELVRTGHFEKAATHYQTVVKLDPRNGFARFMLAIVLARLRRYGEALGVLEESHLAMPDDRDISSALARLLAACPDSSIRNGHRALQLIQQALENQQSVDIEETETLAMVLAEVGSFEKAIEIQQTIISAAGQAGRPDLARALTETLVLYRQGKPSRQPWRDDDPVFNPAPEDSAPVTPGLGVVSGMAQETQR